MVRAAPSKRRAAVISHRGEHLRNPENSLAGIEAAAKMGVDYVEMDIRTTGDGKLILMHDSSVDRTTTGDAKGAVSALTFNQIRALQLKGGGAVPAFHEALEVLRPTQTGLYLDAKQISATDIISSLREHRMTDRTVVYGGFKLLQELAAQGSSPRIMPEARSVAVLRKLLEELKPRVVAFDRSDWKDDVIALARDGGVTDLFVDRLGPDDTPEAWEDAIRRGATGIQTDHPADALALVAKV